MEHGSTTGLRLCLKQQKEINAHSRFSFSFIFFPLSRIVISNILSFDFISFKRTSIILLSQILFSTHLFFLSVFCFEVPKFCFFIYPCVGSFRPLWLSEQESVFTGASLCLVRCCLSQRCHCFDHVVFLLVFFYVDIGLHHQFRLPCSISLFFLLKLVKQTIIVIGKPFRLFAICFFHFLLLSLNVQSFVRDCF